MTTPWVAELNDALAVHGQATAEAAQSIWTSLAQEMDVNGYRPQPHAKVTVTRVADGAGDYFVLKNTESKTYLRLSPEEQEVWLQMNGEKSVHDLVVDRFVSTGSFAHNMIVQLVYQLRANRMLLEEPEYVWGSVRQELHKRNWGNKVSRPARALLTQQLEIPGIDRVTTLIYRSVGWLFFTLPIRVLLIVVALAGLILYNRIIANQDYVFFRQAGASELLLLWAAAILPVLIHELGHALTVKHYGREINAGGLMLYFGLPAAYVDTTDIWLADRRARLNVTWNGPYTGLILGGICAISMSLFPEFAFNSFLFKMASVAYLTVFLNVNPLLKYDGYYILSDLLRISFLRERSMAFLQQKFPKKLLRREKWTRDEKIFTVFGALSVVWTVYALYLASVFWRVRLSTSLQVLLGSDYNILSKLLNLLSTGAIVSLLLLLLIQAIRFLAGLINRYVRGGGLQRHRQLAMVGGVLAAALAFGLPRLFPQYQAWVFLALAVVFPLFTSIRMLRFSRSEYRGNRLRAQLAFSALLLALAFIPITAQLPVVDPAYGIYLVGISMGLSILSGIIFILRAWEEVRPAQVLVVLAVGLLLALTGWRLALPVGLLALVAATGMIAILDWLTLQGSARAPALALTHAGVLVAAIGFASLRSIETLWIFGIVLACMGVWHLVLARIPRLTKAEFPISPNNKVAIASSVSILVRRVISQVFFESGWAGVRSFGAGFNSKMQQLGINLAIDSNQFQDGELEARHTFDLTEVYGVAFDRIYDLLKSRFGGNYARTTIGHGVDLIPWQFREVTTELVLDRRGWGERLNQETRDKRARRIKLLERVALFIGAAHNDLRAIAVTLEPHQYAAGETIIRQGDPGDAFFIIESGKVQVWQSEGEAESQQVNALAPGQFFGEVALVTDAPRNATIIAETPCVLLSLGRRDFDVLVKHHLAFAENIQADLRSKWILRNMPIFDELDAIELNYLTNKLQTETFTAGEMVVEQGDIGDKFFIIEAGELRVFQQTNGHSVDLNRLSPGDYFGEIALIQQRPRTASVEALTDATLFSLEAQAFTRMLAESQRVKQSLEKTGSRRERAG
jgi:putative peptide zinc metalloprotease protein